MTHELEEGIELIRGQLNEQLADVEGELFQIHNEESAEATIIEGEEFNHAEWLSAERAEIYEKREAMTKVEAEEGTLWKNLR